MLVVETETGNSGAEKPYERLKAYVVSDVHLNNHPYDSEHESENPRRRNFRLFLTQLNETLLPTDKILLILNGDILDVNGSWADETMPWDEDGAKVEAILNPLVLDIMENNGAAFEEMRRLLKHPLSEIVYVYGNHNGLLQKYPASNAVIKDFLADGEAEKARIHFVESFESEELDLYCEHGHRLDPFNRHDHGHQPPLGDIINILVVNRFVELVIQRLKDNGYPDDFIRRMHARLHDIEYLRPLSLLPVWIQTVANQYQSHPVNTGKRNSVKAIMMGSVKDILLDPKMMRLARKNLPLPPAVLSLLVHIILSLPAILPMVSFVASKLMRKTHSNKAQYEVALRLHNEKGYRLVAFGHTHIPGLLPLSKSAYYFNTGCWKPVINLFKYSQDPVELEYLNPDVQFNKVERCGILRMEKLDASAPLPAEFALQTIQSGLS